MVTEQISKYYLYPSTLFAHDTTHMVDTILGSCVAVCLYDLKLRVGGINHYMLPYWNGEGLASPKYGNIANEKLLERLLQLGASKQNMVAKIFGGANQLKSNIINVGERNVLVAREQMAAFGIRVIYENVGGHEGRRIKYNTGTNEVWLKFLGSKKV
jgi:chemotaxis protein CheD